MQVFACSPGLSENVSAAVHYFCLNWTAAFLKKRLQLQITVEQLLAKPLLLGGDVLFCTCMTKTTVGFLIVKCEPQHNWPRFMYFTVIFHQLVMNTRVFLLQRCPSSLAWLLSADLTSHLYKKHFNNSVLYFWRNSNNPSRTLNWASNWNDQKH